MASTRWATVRRAVGEAAVITAGVLLALAADEWRQQADRSTREVLVLEELLSEFQANSEQLNQIGARHQAEMEAASLLLHAALGDSVPELGIPELISSVLLSNWRFDPRTGALDSYVAGGDLGLIRNSELRSALAEWPRSLSELWQQEDRVFAFVDGMAAEFLVSETDRLSLIGRGAGGGPAQSVGGQLRQLYRPEVDMGALLSLPRLHNLATVRVTLTHATLLKYRRLVEAHATVIDLIESELKR